MENRALHAPDAISPPLLGFAAGGGGPLPSSSPSLNILMASKFRAHTPRMKAFFMVSSYWSLSAWRRAISFLATSNSRVAYQINSNISWKTDAFTLLTIYPVQIPINSFCFCLPPIPAVDRLT